MQNSESPTQNSAGVPALDIRLDRAPIGRPAILVSIAGDVRADPGARSALAEQLAAEGLVAGVVLTPERHLPLGGPVVVGIGRARVALGRDVARRLLVRDAGEGRVPASGRGTAS